VDFCDKSSEFADFENTVDRGCAVNFGADSGLCEIWIIDLSSALVGMLMSSSKLFLFSNEAHLNSGVRLLLELYCVIVIKHVAFLAICAKLTMAFTFTSLSLSFCTSVSGCVVVLDLNKNIGGSTGSAKKEHGSADLYTPIHPPLKQNPTPTPCPLAPAPSNLYHDGLYLPIRVATITLCASR